MFGILVALPLETRKIVTQRMQVGDTYPLSEHAQLIVTGMGKAALPIIKHYAESGQFSTLISLGTAVALSPLVKSGTLCIPDEVVLDAQTLSCHQGLQTQFIAALTNTYPIVRKRMTHTHHVLTGLEEKIQLSQTTQAVAADMESFLIAQEAWHAQIDFLAIRVVLDSMALHLPPALLDCCMPVVSVPRLLRTLVRQPRWLVTLLAFAHQFNQAKKTLHGVTKVAVLQAKTKHRGNHVI